MTVSDAGSVIIVTGHDADIIMSDCKTKVSFHLHKPLQPEYAYQIKIPGGLLETALGRKVVFRGVAINWYVPLQYVEFPLPLHGATINEAHPPDSMLSNAVSA